MAYLDNDGLLYFWQQIKTKFAAASHMHAIADTRGLQAALDSKATFITRSNMDAALAQEGIATPLDYTNAKTFMANAGMFYQDGEPCVNVIAMAEVINALCNQIDANTAAGSVGNIVSGAVAVRVQISSSPADATGDTSKLTATVWRGGERLSDEAVARMGLLAWYVGGSRVATGGTYTCAAGTAVECRVEA